MCAQFEVVSLHLLSPGCGIQLFFVYSVLLFSSALLGTVESAVCSPQPGAEDQRPPPPLWMMQPARGSWTGSGRTLSCAQRADHHCSREENHANSTYLQLIPSPVPPHCSPKARPQQKLPLLQLSSKHSMLGAPVCIHLPAPGLGAALPAALQPSSNPEGAQF